MQFAQKINDNTVKSAFPALFSNIAKCYEELNEPDEARKNHELAKSFNDKPSDQGPFYHGTKAGLQVGDLLTAGGNSNYKSELKMNLKRPDFHVGSINWNQVIPGDFPIITI